MRLEALPASPAAAVVVAVMTMATESKRLLDRYRKLLCGRTLKRGIMHLLLFNIGFIKPYS
jgi:hypothetical protein